MMSQSPASNLDSFLNFTTPTVPSRILTKTCVPDFSTNCQPVGKDKVEHFNLGDLWDCYCEWSAYGVGAPVNVGGETVVQYYTPYLSAIQIYTDKSISLRDMREDSDEFESKSWTSESEDEKFSRTSSNNSDRTWDSDDFGNIIEACLPARNRFGELYCEYFEYDGPFGRVPLKDKIDILACKYPQLKTLTSVDLSPASWMAVAWYPIYHIPVSSSSKELCASFLTYHTLSSSFQDNIDYNIDHSGSRKMEDPREDDHHNISLHPFGIAPYRMQPRVWLNPETSDREKMFSLLSAADSWLKQLRVQHPDFNFFMSHHG